VVTGCKVPLQALDRTVAHLFATKTGNHPLWDVACLKAARVTAGIVCQRFIQFPVIVIGFSGLIITLSLYIIVVLLSSKDLRGMEMNNVVQQAHWMIVFLLIFSEQLALGIRSFPERCGRGAYRGLIFSFPVHLIYSCGDRSNVTRFSLLVHADPLR
jgi:hypothetical protein